MAISHLLVRRGRSVRVTADGGAVGANTSAADGADASVPILAVQLRVAGHQPDRLDGSGFRDGSVPPPPPARGPMAASQAPARGGLSRRSGSAVPLRGSHDSPAGACGRAAIGAGDGAPQRFPA